MRSERPRCSYRVVFKIFQDLALPGLTCEGSMGYFLLTFACVDIRAGVGFALALASRWRWLRVGVGFAFVLALASRSCWRWLRVRSRWRSLALASAAWYIVDAGRTTSLRGVRTRAKKEEERERRRKKNAKKYY